MCLFVLLNTNEDIWKNVLIKQISIPIDYHSRKIYMKKICRFFSGKLKTNDRLLILKNNVWLRFKIHYFLV